MAEDLRLEERLELVHALCQHVSDERGIDILPVKGVVASRQFTARARLGSDVDLLVRPGQTDALRAALNACGWRVGSESHELDLSNHAVVLEHPVWGVTIDLHRHFPGFAAPAEEVFAALWERRKVETLAGRQCVVPDRVGHGAVLIVNSARNPHSAEAQMVKAWWSPEELEVGVRLVRQLGGSDAAATRLPDLFDPESSTRYWRVVSDNPTGTAMWLARIWDTPGVLPRLRLLGHALLAPSVWGRDNRLTRRIARTPQHWVKGARQLPGAATRMVKMLRTPRR